MTPKAIADSSTQVALRLDDDIIKRAEELIPKMSPRDIRLTRTDILRTAVRKGIELMEKETEEALRRHRSMELLTRGRALTVARLSGIPRFTVGVDPNSLAITLIDGRRVATVNTLDEAIHAMMRWPGSRLAVNDDGVLYNLDSGDGIDPSGAPMRVRVPPKR